jgi:uncharacterized FlaG/YvyC family protein
MTTPSVSPETGKAGELPFAFVSSASGPSRKDFIRTGPPDSTAVVDTETARIIMESIRQNLESLNVTISFSRYGRNGQNIAITILEKDTGKVVREIPPQEMQRLSMKMEELVGMIFNDMA